MHSSKIIRLHGIISIAQHRLKQVQKSISLQKFPRRHQVPQHHLQVKINNGSVHPAYNPSFSACFFQSEQYFSLTTNQPTVFFSRLISPAERGQ
jgi:hypothetical protein